MKFKKIVSIDYTGVDEFVHEELISLCDTLVTHEDFPQSEEEIVRRAKGADVILVSWNTLITANVLKQLPNLKYVGMCCSLYDESAANVDIARAREQGIIVKGVKDYGDDGVVEYFISELIRLFKGLGDVQWRDQQIELKGVKLGIIGLGTLGSMIADAAQYFGMVVYYNNRNKREDAEERGIAYMPLDTLLRTCDVITTHLPKFTIIIRDSEFEDMGEGKVFINTSLSPTYDLEAFDKWIARKGNFAIFDAGGMTEDMRLKYADCKNIISTRVATGFTKNGRGRLASKVIDKLRETLKELAQ